VNNIGKKVPGRNNVASAAGAATYVDDVNPAGCLRLIIVRSPYPHAKILSIDASRVRERTDVHLVLTGEMLREEGVTVTSGGGTNVGYTVRSAVRHMLAVDKVRYVGEPVVAIVANDYISARDAADAVTVSYEPLTVIADALSGLADGAPLVEPTWSDNVMIDYPIRRGDASAVLEITDTDLTCSGSLVCNRIAATPLETRGMVADYKPFQETLTCWASTQSPHVLRATLADILHLPSSQVRVVQPQVGGAFGSKIPFFPEDVVVAFASIKLGRPVKWIEQRHEYLIAGGHSRDVRCDYRAAFDSDGRITALDIDLIADIGAQSTFSGWLMAVVSASCIPGSYKLDDVSVRLRAVVSNRGPWQAYRGYGKEVASFFMERILDDVARRTATARHEVRLRNFISSDQFPYQQPCGWTTDSGNYAGTLTAVRKLINWDGFAAIKAAAQAEGRYVGIGLGHELTPEGSSRPDSLMNGADSATVRVGPRGDVTVLTGVTSPGTGNETGIAQIVADTLGADLDRVRVQQGDTDSSPHGNGNYSSRSLTFGGSSAHLAAVDIAAKLTLVGSRMLDVNMAEVHLKGHHVVAASGASIPIDAVAAEIYRNPHGKHMTGVEPSLEVTRAFRMSNIHHRTAEDGRYNQYPTWSFSSAACIVEVFPSTGQVRVDRFALVHDCGLVVNPLLAEAQLQGAITQGIGASLYEEIAYDVNAMPQTESLREYTLIGAREGVEIAIGHQSTPSPFTLMGMKGVGESGISAPAATIASAIDDALDTLGVRMTVVPFTPARVWAAIAAAAASTVTEVSHA